INEDIIWKHVNEWAEYQSLISKIQQNDKTNKVEMNVSEEKETPSEHNCSGDTSKFIFLANKPMKHFSKRIQMSQVFISARRHKISIRASVRYTIQIRQKSAGVTYGIVNNQQHIFAHQPSKIEFQFFDSYDNSDNGSTVNCGVIPYLYFLLEE
ncbi:hypothetical protein RFI_36046, partial [Reticulomyxa filosa]